MQKKYVIIVAGGKGTRMDSDLPKQFHLIDDRPVLMHTMECFTHSSLAANIILVLHADMRDYWADLCTQYAFNCSHVVVDGGATRFQSVRNGLNKILEKETVDLENVVIAIHDAARPLLNKQLISRCFAETDRYGATTVAVQSTSSIRLGDADRSEATNRDRVWIVQTPQTFKADILKKAFAQQELPSFTDDASVVEKLGYPIHLIPGDHSNIKITFPEDIAIAQLYVRARKAKLLP